MNSLKSLGLSLLAILTAVIGIFAYGRKSGSDAVKAKQAEKTIKDVKAANEISENVRSLGDSDINERLRKYTRK